MLNNYLQKTLDWDSAFKQIAFESTRNSSKFKRTKYTVFSL